MSKNTTPTQPSATDEARDALALESLEIIAIDALQGIEAMADIAARECDRAAARSMRASWCAC